MPFVSKKAISLRCILFSKILLESLRSTTRQQRQLHKFCIFNEHEQKLCTPFKCLFHFCTFHARSRQMGDVKWPFLKFYREREHTAANLNFLPLLFTSKFSSWVVPLAFKSQTNWHNDGKDAQTWTCNFERRFQYRCVVDLKLPIDNRKRLWHRGVARIFQRGVTLCQSEGTHQIVTMAKVSSWHFQHLL